MKLHEIPMGTKVQFIYHGWKRVGRIIPNAHVAPYGQIPKVITLDVERVSNERMTILDGQDAGPHAFSIHKITGFEIVRPWYVRLIRYILGG